MFYFIEFNSSLHVFNLIFKVYIQYFKESFSNNFGGRIRFNKLGKHTFKEDDVLVFPFVLAMKKKTGVFNLNCKKICINTEPIYFENKWVGLIDRILKHADYVLDYTPLNIKYLEKKGFPSDKVFMLPPTYSQVYEDQFKYHSRDLGVVEKEIDILFFGSLSSRRKMLLEQLKNADMKVYNLRLFDSLKSLNEAIMKSRIVIIPFHNPGFKEYDFYRAPYLICNKVLVVHEDVCDENNLKGLRENLILVKYSNFVSKIKELLALNQGERDKLASKHYEYFKERWNMSDLKPFDNLS